MLVCVIVFLVTAVLFACLYFFQRAEAKWLTKQLEKLNEEERIQTVTVSLPSRTNQELVREINRFLAERQEAERLRRVDELRLQEMISNVSHDMRTPLTAILGYIRLINGGEITEEERRRYLEIIEARAIALRKLVSDFYDLSRMDEGSYGLHMEPTDVVGCCLELLAELYDSFEKAGITSEIDLTAEAPKVSADREAVRRVFENLFRNAEKYSEGRLWVSSRLEENRLLLSVSNTSPYFSPEQLSRLSDRAYTGDRSRSEGNTGLGLAICKSLIEQMGHEIHFGYENGIFTVSLIFYCE